MGSPQRAPDALILMSVQIKFYNRRKCATKIWGTYVAYLFWGGPVAREIKWVGPGEPPSLPMLMTTTGIV